MCQKDEDRYFLQQAIDLAVKNVESQGGPFAAIVVKDGKIVATGANRVTANNDPTAHAEVTAIRNACSQLNAFQLEGCTIYASCEPCPMCLGYTHSYRQSRGVHLQRQAKPCERHHRALRQSQPNQEPHGKRRACSHRPTTVHRF